MPRGLAPLAALLLLAAPPAPAQAQAVSAHLAAMEAGYGPEAWKDEPPVAGTALRGVPVLVPPPGVLGVYENPYADPARPHQGPRTWLGYNLTATIEVRGGAATASYVIGARLETAQGSVPAKLARVAPARFTAQLDLDGENGASFPEVPPGAARLVVEVYEVSPDPTVVSKRVATAQFTVDALPAGLDRGGFLLDEEALPGYADVGPGNQTLVEGAPAKPGEPFSVVASLGAPDARARVVAWHRTQGAIVAEGRTDAEGRFVATVEPGLLTGANRTGLAVLEAHLDGSAGKVASALVAVPVSPHETRVARYVYEGHGVAGRAVEAADTLFVGVEDPTAGPERPARGTLLVLDASGEEVVSVPFEPGSFAPTRTERTARVPALALQREGLASYRVLALLLTADGRLYSLAQAVRGYGIAGGSAEARPFEEGILPILVRNFNNNLDATRDEGMALVVSVRVTGLPGNGAFESEVRVEESAEARLAVPFRGDVGVHAVALNTTSGELRQDLRGTIRIAAEPQRFLGIPGPALPLLALALLLAAIAQRRARER